MWPFKKKKTTLSRERFVQSIPLANPVLKWEQAEDGTITLLVPRSKGGILGFLSGSVSLPEHRQVKLDEVGSKVWRKIDGKKNIKEFIDWMDQEFKMNPREAEISLGVFMERLSDKGYVLLLVPPPKPGTQEAKDEAAELRKRLKNLEKDFKAQKMNEQEYTSIKKQIENRLEAMKEKTE